LSHKKQMGGEVRARAKVAAGECLGRKFMTRIGAKQPG